MALKLNLSGGTGGRSTRILTTGTLSMGRGEQNDWMLADPERHLSKTHCVLSNENGRYVLTDLSTNGVYINGARQPTARDSRVVLTDGDEFRLGDYTVLVEEVAAPPEPEPLQTARGNADPLDIDPLDDPLGRPPDPSFSHPVHHAPAASRAEDPFDRVDENRSRIPDPDSDLFAGVKPAVSWTGPSQSDHADAPRHSMEMPRVAASPNLSEIDFDALIGDIASLQPSPPAAAAPRPELQRAGLPKADLPKADLDDPFAGLDDLFAPPSVAPPPPAPPAPTPVQAAPAVPAFVPAASPVPAPTAPAAAPADAMRAALRAFLEGAGVANAPMHDDPETALRNVGEVFRTLTEGLREVLMSRAAIKGELRVEQTLLKSSNNNPLKFSFSPEDAMIALLSSNRPGYMPPVAAAREAFTDIKTHELAVMAGVQTALTSLLRRFDPDALEASLSQGKLASVLPSARKARLWESFSELYKTIASEAEDDFQAVFGRAFAKAYKAQSRRD